MDDTDTKILRHLAVDGRISWADLGAAVGLSAPGVADRVRRLEEQGVLRGFEARIDARKVGYGLTAFVAVSLGRERDRAAFLEKIEGLPEVLECHHLAGEDDYLLKVRCQDTDDLERLLVDGLRAHGGVARTRTTIALKTVKETGAPPSVSPRRRKRR